MSEDLKPLVYVAGPITKPVPLKNMLNAIEVGEEILSAGIVHPFLPQLSAIWDAIYPKKLDEWLGMDFEVIRRCDALLRLPGESEGADREVQFAALHSIPIFYTVDSLHLWAKVRAGEFAPLEC